MILLPQRKFRILANRHGSWWYRKDRCYKSWLVPIHCDAFWSYQPTLHFLEVEGGCPSRIAVGRVPSVFRWYYCSWINFWSNRRERAFFLRLREVNLILEPSKCSFNLQTSFKFLWQINYVRELNTYWPLQNSNNQELRHTDKARGGEDCLFGHPVALIWRPSGLSGIDDADDQCIQLIVLGAKNW